MELFLNIVWVVVAAGVLGAWRVHWIPQRKRTFLRSLWEWTAVSVALVLLFFAVSMTDDLHSEMIVFEECATSRRDLPSVAGAHPALHPGAVLHGDCAGIAPQVSLSEPLFALDSVQPPAEFCASLPHCDPPSDRAPPVSFL
jgi:hypothetical protein